MFLRNKRIWQITAVMVGLIFLFFLVRTFSNRVALEKMLNTRLAYRGQLPPLPLVNGLLTEDEVPGSENFAPSALEANEFAKETDTDRIVEIFQKVPMSLLKNMEKEIPHRVAQGFSNIRPPASAPDFIDIESQNHHHVRAMKTARIWYGFARYMLHCGKPELAMQTMCGILLYAQQLEADPGDAGLLVMMRMSSIYIMKVGARGLLEITPYLNLPGETFQLWAKRLLVLEKQTASMITALRCERNLVPSLISVYAKRNPNHSGVQSLIRSLREDGFLESWISFCYDPFIAAFEEPLPRAMEIVDAHQKNCLRG